MKKTIWAGALTLSFVLLGCSKDEFKGQYSTSKSVHRIDTDPEKQENPAKETDATNGNVETVHEPVTPPEMVNGANLAISCLMQDEATFLCEVSSEHDIPDLNHLEWRIYGENGVEVDHSLLEVYSQSHEGTWTVTIHVDPAAELNGSLGINVTDNLNSSTIVAEISQETNAEGQSEPSTGDEAGYKVFIILSELNAGEQIELELDSLSVSEVLTLTENGTHSFEHGFLGGEAYSINILSPTESQICELDSRQGVIESEDIYIELECSDDDLLPSELSDLEDLLESVSFLMA